MPADVIVVVRSASSFRAFADPEDRDTHRIGLRGSNGSLQSAAVAGTHAIDRPGGRLRAGATKTTELSQRRNTHWNQRDCNHNQGHSCAWRMDIGLKKRFVPHVEHSSKFSGLMNEADLQEWRWDVIHKKTPLVPRGAMRITSRDSGMEILVQCPKTEFQPQRSTHLAGALLSPG